MLPGAEFAKVSAEVRRVLIRLLDNILANAQLWYRLTDRMGIECRATERIPQVGGRRPRVIVPHELQPRSSEGGSCQGKSRVELVRGAAKGPEAGGFA